MPSPRNVYDLEDRVSILAQQFLQEIVESLHLVLARLVHFDVDLADRNSCRFQYSIVQKVVEKSKFRVFGVQEELIYNLSFNSALQEFQKFYRSGFEKRISRTIDDQRLDYGILIANCEGVKSAEGFVEFLIAFDGRVDADEAATGIEFLESLFRVDVVTDADRKHRALK
ncbi:hypothetical protein L596_029790 [Steinernema carpocapsae]|uniref:Uncharacterized protein n=1 Tax=Steinernema carpocapsae TaxID=34508 RepID=A0A4U5LQU5_STECR|nr:hypothetical protein L596_029790 [Steinernema carpocapsae]